MNKNAEIKRIGKEIEKMLPPTNLTRFTVSLDTDGVTIGYAGCASDAHGAYPYRYSAEAKISLSLLEEIALKKSDFTCAITSGKNVKDKTIYLSSIEVWQIAKHAKELRSFLMEKNALEKERFKLIMERRN